MAKIAATKSQVLRAGLSLPLRRISSHIVTSVSKIAMLVNIAGTAIVFLLVLSTSFFPAGSEAEGLLLAVAAGPDLEQQLSGLEQDHLQSGCCALRLSADF
jgi:hypothetical protein